MTQHLNLKPVRKALYGRVQTLLTVKVKLLREAVQIVSTPGTKHTSVYAGVYGT